MYSYLKFLLVIGVILLHNTSAFCIPIDKNNAVSEEYIHTGEEGNDHSTSNNDVFNEAESYSNTETNYCNIAKIVALNKITAKSQTLTFKLGEAEYFGNVEIKIHKCLKNNNPYSPYSSILITVVESKTDEDPITIFQGWMVSSNISISTLEHPIYEIFAKDCL